LSPALGTFVAGVVLAESEYRHELETDIEPFKGLLLGLFFIAVGASIDFGLIAARPGLIAGLVLGLVLVKFAVLFVLGRVFKMGLDQNMLFAFALAQGGEFAFVLFSFAGQNNILDADITGPLVAVVALSMALSPLLMLINERLGQPRFGTKRRADREADAIEEENRVIVAGFGRFGHIIGRLLTANGVGTTVLDIDSDRVELLRKLGIKVFYGDATRHDLLHAAGADKAELLVLALDDPEKIRKLVDTAQKHFPNLTILARAFDRGDAYELFDAGVEHVYRDTLDTSLRLGVDALRHLGFRAYQAHRAAQKFRIHDVQVVREMTAVRHDRKQYMNVARHRIRELEEILRADIDDQAETKDMGWDAETLRADFGAKFAAEPE
jgi:voltage-gated potassium channel Kch